MHWNCYEKYLNTLLSHLHRKAKPNYMKCTIRQIVEADRLCWSHLIEQNIRPRPSPGDPLSLDTKLQAALESYHVSFELMPLPLPPPKRKESWPDRPPKASNGNAKGHTKQRQKARPGASPRPKLSSRFLDPFVARVALQTQTAPRICFDYSLGECKQGENCSRGKHVCAICYGNHRMVDHPKG